MRIKQIKGENKAIQRSIQLKDEKQQAFKTKNQEKEAKIRPRQQLMNQTANKYSNPNQWCDLKMTYNMIFHCRKRVDLMKLLEYKLELAKQRKQTIQSEKRLAKKQTEIEYFKKHTAFRQEVFQKNIKLFELYQKEQHENIKVILCSSNKMVSF